MKSPLLRFTLITGLVVSSLGCKEKPKEETKAEPAISASPVEKAPEPSGEKTGSATTAASGATANLAALDPATAKEQAPASYKARFTTSKGDFVVEVTRDWAPQGADRFYNLVKHGFFSEARFFRAIDGFMVQFGINGDPAVSAKWREATIPDDPVKQSNKRGYVTFATSGPNSRTTQLFINFGNNANLDGMGFAPFGKVATGMDVVDGVYKGYGEGAPGGAGPNQGRIQAEGNAYLNRDFPKLDWVKEAKIE
jgi:peptidyl-prolyl cis-trans isomerase A (cyclophilin A)